MIITRLSPLEQTEFRQLVTLFQSVFESDYKLPDDQYFFKLLSNPDFLAFVIKDGERVVGGLTIYVLHAYYVDKPMAYLYDLAINPAFQRKGLGRKLVQYVCDYCKGLGFAELFVEAEADDWDAIQFYRSTHYRVEQPAIQFNFLFE